MTARLTSIQSRLPEALPGMLIGIGGNIDTASFLNGMYGVAAVNSFTITDATQVFSITINGVTVEYDAPVGDDADDIRDGLIAAILADARVNTLVLPTSGGAGVVLLTELQPELGAVVYSVSANIVNAVVTAHVAETGIQAGVFAVFMTDVADAAIDGQAVRLPTTGSTFAQLAGVIESNMEANDERYPAPSLAQFRPGDSMTIVRKGSIWVIAETAMARAAAVHMRIIASGVNTNLGAVRNAADGGNSVQLTSGVYSTGREAYYGSLRLVELQINLPV